MKRVLTVLVFLSGAYILHAEQMTFVTTLSSPLGTFAQLETADYSATTSVPLLNFCNTRASVGTVTLKGANSYLQTLSLKNGTTLGGNTPEYRISGTLSVNNNSEVTGGRLLANTATVSGASSAKSKVEDTLYAASLKVKGAKAANLTIPGQVETAGNAQGASGQDMHWSNEYPCTYAEVASGSTGEIDSIEYGDWKADLWYNESCDDNALEEFKPSGSNVSSCTDCRLVGGTLSGSNYFTEVTYPLVSPDYFDPDRVTDDGEDADREWGCYQHSLGDKCYYTGYGGTKYESTSFFDYTKNLLSSDPGSGDLTDDWTQSAKCVDSGGMISSSYRSGDWTRFLSWYSGYLTGGGVLCYWIAIKTECRTVKVKYKESSQVECVGNKTEFKDSYLLKSY